MPIIIKHYPVTIIKPFSTTEITNILFPNFDDNPEFFDVNFLNLDNNSAPLRYNYDGNGIEKAYS